MNRTKIETIGALALLLSCAGCFSTRPRDHLIVLRQPWQMIEPVPQRLPLPVASEETEAVPEADEGDTTADSPKRPLTQPETPEVDATAAEVIEEARRHATQQPSAEAFVDAVQVYDYEPGAVYEVITAPGFVTVLRLRLGEEILHLAAGDTSRWLIEAITSGVTDPQGSLADTLLVEPRLPQATRVSVLIKPRRPLIQTNLVIATNQRTYLIDLKSVDVTAYHSVVEWTYPKEATHKLSVIRSSAFLARDDGTRNYAYLIKTPPGNVPRWTPVSVYDDGHRVYVRFPKGIDDLRRPPVGLDPAAVHCRPRRHRPSGELPRRRTFLRRTRVVRPRRTPLRIRAEIT